MSFATVVRDHLNSLPVAQRKDSGKVSHWPRDAFYVLPPLLTASFIWVADPKMNTAAVAGLLAGVGVLGGLLVQVLASVGGRIGALADAVEGRAASPVEKARIQRLIRANNTLTYATYLSLILVLTLASAVLLSSVPCWLTFLILTVFLHWLATLALVVSRVSRIGDIDSDETLSSGARQSDKEHP